VNVIVNVISDCFAAGAERDIEVSILALLGRKPSTIGQCVVPVLILVPED
jgi:hypothetical protein